MTAIYETVRKTVSVCPVCLKRLAATWKIKDNHVYLVKACPEHGEFSTVIWRGKSDLWEWMGLEPKIGEGENLNCPTACGLCPDHRQDTCCTLLEVTKRCNLRCNYCFAESGGSQDPPMEDIIEQLRMLTVPGKTLVQLSGGEPTVRDDLPQIVAAAKALGCLHVQLNTNGIRLAEEPEFLAELVKAGLSIVFLQFDGTQDDIYRKLRGRPLLELKKRAIQNCQECRVGVILVPMLVPGVNTQNIGDLVKYGISLSPTVRGVHFQPVSYFGRTPKIPTDDMRFTVDELISSIETQTQGLINGRDLVPSSCNHPLCGLHGDFVVTGDGLTALTKKSDTETGCLCGAPATADQKREFVGRRWGQRPPENPKTCCCGNSDIHDMECFLSRVKAYGFTITAMAFQDAGTLDIERLRRCSLHVFDHGKFVPFCSYYLSGWSQE